jgi:hypothetical protein
LKGEGVDRWSRWWSSRNFITVYDVINKGIRRQRSIRLVLCCCCCCCCNIPLCIERLSTSLFNSSSVNSIPRQWTIVCVFRFDEMNERKKQMICTDVLLLLVSWWGFVDERWEGPVTTSEELTNVVIDVDTLHEWKFWLKSLVVGEHKNTIIQNVNETQ